MSLIEIMILSPEEKRLCLIDKSIIINRRCARTFVELADKKETREKAREYYEELNHEIQDYIKYSDISQEGYRNVFGGDWQFINYQ